MLAILVALTHLCQTIMTSVKNEPSPALFSPNLSAWQMSLITQRHKPPDDCCSCCRVSLIGVDRQCFMIGVWSSHELQRGPQVHKLYILSFVYRLYGSLTLLASSLQTPPLHAKTLTESWNWKQWHWKKAMPYQKTNKRKQSDIKKRKI